MKVEVNVLGSPSLNSPYGLCGRKATLENANVITSELRSCVKVEADVPGLHVSKKSLRSLWT